MKKPGQAHTGTERHGVKKKKLAEAGGRRKGKKGLNFQFAASIEKSRDRTEESVEALLRLDRQARYKATGGRHLARC